MKKNYIIALFFIIIPLIQLFAQPAWVRKQATPQENTLNDITRVPGTNKLVAVGEGSTVMISEDAGESWQIILHPAGFHNGYNCKTVKFIDENTGFIGGSYRTMLKTTNGGYYWTKVIDATTDYEHETFQSIAFPVHDIGFAVNDLGEVYKTVNTGSAWNEIQLNPYFIPANIMFLDNSKGYIFGYMTNECLKTEDGGLTWDSIGIPNGLPGYKEIYSLKFINESVGFMNIHAASGGEIYRTGDGGTTWIKVYSYWSLFDCRFCFADNVNGIGVYIDYAYHNEILITHDGGLTWEQNTNDYLPWYSANGIQFISPDTYITVGRHIGNINRSTDGGIHWESAGRNAFRGNINNVEVFDDINLIAIAEDLTGGVTSFDLMKSTDYGETWSRNSVPDIWAGGFDFISPDTGFIANEFSNIYSVYRTIDAGANWENFEIGEGWVFRDLTFNDFYHGMAITESNLYRTLDAGETWENITAGINNGAIYKIEYLNNEKVIGLGVFMDTTCIYVSGDGGDTWQVKTIGKFSYPQTLYLFNDSTFFVSTYSHIFKTTDGGDSWISGNFDQSYSILINSIYFPSADTGYAVGGGAYINALRTVDGGLNWTVSETNASSVLNKVYFNDNNHGLAFGNLGVVLETTTGGVADARKPDKAVQQIYFSPQPNPFTDQLTLQFETANNAGKSTLVITDLSGKTIKTISIGGKIDRLLLNLPQLSKGVYLLNLYQGNRLLQSEKVVKQ